MKKIFLFLALVMFGNTAFAGPWTVGQQTATWTSSHPLGSPNTAPAYGYEEADIASNFTESTWLHTSPPGGQFDGPGVGSEAKARFDCNVSFHNANDPIIFPGIANGSPHDHTFFGNLAAATNTQNVTYASLRSAGNSTCYGGPLNRSLYWEPTMKKLLATGYIASIIPKNVVTYYEEGVLSSIGTGSIDDPLVGTRWARGWNAVFGFNTNDPTDTKMANAIAAADAANGSPRYSRAPAGAGGFVGWTCVTPNTGATAGGHYANSPVAGAYQPYLRNADGTAALDCLPGTDLIAEVVSYPCWDRVNLTSPNGRDHMMAYIRDGNTGKLVCPDGWSRVMQLRAKATFNQSGAADYKEWFLSSDRMAGMTTFLNGQTFHADFIPAWSYGTAASPGVFLRFTVHCDGITVVMSGTTLTGDGHECGTGRIDSLAQVWANEASPDGSSPNPLVVLSPDQTGTKRYFPVLPGETGNGHFHHGKPCTQAAPCQSMNDNMRVPANDQLAGAAPISFDLRSKGR